MEYLSLDLDDLGTIKMSADEFLSKEERLDVLWNNAGVMVPPAGSKTKQVGHSLQKIIRTDHTRGMNFNWEYIV